MATRPASSATGASGSSRPRRCRMRRRHQPAAQRIRKAIMTLVPISVSIQTEYMSVRGRLLRREQPLDFDYAIRGGGGLLTAVETRRLGIMGEIRSRSSNNTPGVQSHLETSPPGLSIRPAVLEP